MERAKELIECEFFERDETLVLPWPPEVIPKGVIRASCPHQQCKFATTWKQTMKRHWQNVHKTEIIVEAKRKTISTHTRPVLDELYCAKCENRWNNLERFQNHVCGRTTKNNWDHNKCNICKWRFKTKIQLHDHKCEGPPKPITASQHHNDDPKRFIPEKPPPDAGPLFMYGIEIKRTEQFKYLGTIITEDGRDNTDLKARIASANRTFYRMHNLLKTSLSTERKIKLLNVVIMAILLYGSETWTLTIKQKKSLQAFHNKALRIITGKFPVITKNKSGEIINITYPHYSDLLQQTESQDIIEKWEERVHNFRIRLGTLPKPDPVWTLPRLRCQDHYVAASLFY